MAEVRPFRGVRFRLQRPECAGELISPPYDVISPEGRAALAARHPHNVVQLELPEPEEGDASGESRYARAADLYRSWRNQGILAAEDVPSLYVYGQRYSTLSGEAERLGLVAALRVEPYSTGVVLPHEQTFPRHKEDRYRLLTTARVQFSPIFGLYAAPEAAVRATLAARAAGPAAAVARDPEGVEHRLWPVADPAFAEWARDLFAERQVFIADGHHRYETALRLQTEMRQRHGEPRPGQPLPPWEFVMTFLVELGDPGLVLLPTHRLVRGGLPPATALDSILEPHFTLAAVLPGAAPPGHHQLDLVLPGGGRRRLTLRNPRILETCEPLRSPAWRDLDVAILHRLILQELLHLPEKAEVVYTRDEAEAVARAASGEFEAAFLLPAPSVEELKAVAGAGERMPEKSTYFWPKAVTGMVLYPL